MRNKKVAVIGLGYIGLPTSVFIASKGYSVIGVDIKKSIVEDFNNGIVRFFEPGLQELLKDGLQNKRLRASTDVEISDIYIIVVPTPFNKNLKPDVSYVESAIKNIIPILKENDLVVIESTSPIGTTEKCKNLIYKYREDLIDKIFISYCPERVIPGNLLKELENNDRVVGGINPESTLIAKSFYQNLISGIVYSTNSTTAEMCKLVENASRDNQIAFANEISIIADKVGINVWELISLANKHPRVKILNPSPGVGGHCIAVDPYFISSMFPDESLIISTARKQNNNKTLWCVEKVYSQILQFKSLYNKDPKVALMGLSYKPNVDDIRESPAIIISKLLIERLQDIEFNICEPHLDSYDGHTLKSVEQTVSESDIIVYLVNHSIFHEKVGNLNNKLIIDLCGYNNKYN